MKDSDSVTSLDEALEWFKNHLFVNPEDIPDSLEDFARIDLDRLKF